VPTGNQVRIGDASVSGTHATQLPGDAPARTPTRDRMGQVAAPLPSLDEELPSIAEEKTALSTMPPQPEEPGDPYMGKTIADRYKVIGKLGEGGMGVVYLAEHVFIEKKVAVKILSEDFARKADLVARFMQEAKAASKIGHENIIDITDFGETASGSVFFVMEYLEGADLAHHIRDAGAMPLDRVRYIMNQVCRALGAAHSKGIIHRDLKPENIYLIERNGRADFVKILDFGIAKMSSLDEGGSRLTRTGMIFGTPEYMSPEQAKGDRPDHRVDIYAAGCILYEMLTGDVPFHAETFMGVLTKHMFEQPVPPSQRAPQANVPGDIEQVVLKALAKDRDQRFQTMKEMAVALEACIGGDVTAAWGSEGSGVMPSRRFDGKSDPSFKMGVPATKPPDVLAQTVRSPARRTPLIAALVGVGVLAVGGVVAFTMKKPPPLPKPVEAAPITPVVTPLKPEAPKPAEPKVAASHDIAIGSNPTEAEIFEGAEKLGVTPATLKMTESDQPRTLTLHKKGFKDYSLVVTPSKDRTYVPALLRAHEASGHPSSKPAVAQKPVVAPAAPEAKPETKPEPKPAGKLRDLKDPFAN
jgi:serine/threonine-protein kinase